MEGTTQNLRFRHAGGTPYAEPVSPVLVDAHAKAFAALRAMGFREKETREALERTRTQGIRPAGEEVSVEVETLVRAALVMLADAAMNRNAFRTAS